MRALNPRRKLKDCSRNVRGLVCVPEVSTAVPVYQQIQAVNTDLEVAP
jgi:hypothetical protein